jgi:triacylglycerol lipase
MATSYPIILAHGICPFDTITRPFSHGDNQDDDRRHYFRKIRSTLMAHGFTVFHSRVGWASGLESRASDLKLAILGVTDHFRRWPRVHIIAHSMGGLDARWMIYRYRMEGRVASLTTIGTPHLGSAYADWGIRRFGKLIDLAGSVGLNIRGLRNLTRDFCLGLNETLRDFEEHNGVLYRTVAGSQPLHRIYAPMRFSYRILWREEGENDGLVSLKSAMWKEACFMRKIDADHLNQIGWWDRGEAVTGVDRETFERGIRQVYVDIAKGLRD